MLLEALFGFMWIIRSVEKREILISLSKQHTALALVVLNYRCCVPQTASGQSISYLKWSCNLSWLQF